MEKKLDTVKLKKKYDKFLISSKGNVTQLFLESIDRVSKHIYKENYEKKDGDGTPLFIAHYEEFVRDSLSKFDLIKVSDLIELLEYMYIKTYDKYLKDTDLTNMYILTVTDWKTMGEKINNLQFITFNQKLKTFLDEYLEYL